MDTVNAHSRVDTRSQEIKAEVMAQPLPAIVEALKEKLGPTLVAALAGSRDRQVASKWIAGQVEPTDGEAIRLRAALYALRLFTEFESDDIGRNWLLGTDADLQGQSPLLALAAGDLPGVANSALKFIHETHGF